jgi:YbbR domain-containing protein
VSVGDFFQRHVFHNLTLKITSVLLASGLWLAISSSPPSEVSLNTAIIFRNLSPDLEISSENIPSVQVRVRGPERLVRRLQASSLRAELDLQGMKPGEHTFDLTKAIGVPNALEVSHVVPSEIHLRFDVRSSRWVGVQPRVVGTFAAGYHLADVRSDPDKVEVIGPKQQLEAVSNATTDPIDVTGVLNSVTVSRPVYVSDPLLQVRSNNPVRVTVTIQKDHPSSSGNSE